MGKRKAAAASDEESEAEFSNASSAEERPLKQKKTSKVCLRIRVRSSLILTPVQAAQKRKSKGGQDSEEERPIKKKSEVKAKVRRAGVYPLEI